MANTQFTQFFYTKHAMPVLLDCNFVVDQTNGNGLGIRSLKGPGIAAVYMNSSSPAAANPNPAAGYVKIELADNYYRNYGGFMGAVTQLSGASILVAGAGVVSGTTYVITILGTTTTAGWQSLGVPIGIAPAVGLAFVATATTTAAGTGAVQVPNVNGSGIAYVEGVGDGQLSLSATGTNRANPYLIARFMAATSAGVTTPIATAPANNSVVSLKFYLSNSSLTVQGE